METISTRVPWRYTCTLCHLGNLDTHHLKEHIAVTHLKMSQYQCSKCSLKVFSSDAMIHHRAECTGTYIELPVLIGMRALDEFQRLCNESIHREINRKMETLRYFGSALMTALQFNRENPAQNVSQPTSQALNASISCVSTNICANHKNSNLRTPNLSVLSHSNSLSSPSLNTSRIEPGEVETPIKLKDSQGLIVEPLKLKDETTTRKENTFLSKIIFYQKEKIKQEILAKETKEMETKPLISQEVHPIVNCASDESLIFKHGETMRMNSNEAMDVGKSCPTNNGPQMHGSSNEFDRSKKVVFPEQYNSRFFGMSRQQFGFGDYPIGFCGNYSPLMQPSPIPPQWQVPTAILSKSYPGVCPFHPRDCGHRVVLCGSQIIDLDQRVQVFRLGGGCQDLRCLKRHKDSCRSSTLCFRCQEPHHLLFCRFDQVRK